MKRALLSVSDKTGIEQFARRLVSAGFEILSTGGTLAALRDARIPAIPVESVTGTPEMLDGRVKTLHPAVHGGLLARRDLEEHMTTLATHGFAPIDLVAVTLYPFEKTVEAGASFETCIEQIDIGGPSMLRSAAKNHASVTVICDPADYDAVWEEITSLGDTTPENRQRLAQKVFHRTAKYDAAIARYLERGAVGTATDLPMTLYIDSPAVLTLRYGENPHQSARLYGGFFEVFEKLHGKELSFNNIVDIQAAASLAEEFDEPAAVIVKHTNPCGCAVGEDAFSAYLSALATDPASAFGGIVSVNRPIDLPLAEKLNEIFTEVIIAPEFEDAAMAILRKKKDRRLIRQRGSATGGMPVDVKTVANGYLCQTVDSGTDDPASWRVATRRSPTEREAAALAFAWRVSKHTKSNAIVFTDEHRTLGVGAGQMSRVDSSAIAIMKASAAGLSLQGSVVASDAYFPFADGVLKAVDAGATAVVQPGGSIRDEEVIRAADERGIAMLFTGVRHFRH